MRDHDTSRHFQHRKDNGRNIASGFAGWPVRGGRLHEALRDGTVIWVIIIRLRMLACFIPFQLFAFPACVSTGLQQFIYSLKNVLSLSNLTWFSSATNRRIRDTISNARISP